MSTTSGYGYQAPVEGNTAGGGKFGLNPGSARLVKFDYITNGGSGGSVGEALDIVFEINGSPKGYRKFPVTKAYEKQKDGKQKEVTEGPALDEEFNNLNQVIVSILECFNSSESIQTAFAVPIPDFKTFCEISKSTLPAGFETIPLDIFLQYQYAISSGKSQAFLEIPKKVMHGKFVCKAVEPTGSWKEERTATSLKYVDDNGREHPFKRGEWFMQSPFANQLKVTTAAPAGNTGNTGNGDVKAVPGW